MYQEVEKFFLAFFGENFETSVLQAFFVCFTLMLVYGIIIRPFINLINGKQKRSFFDIITITLIILIGVKILFPAAFSFNVVVGSSGSSIVTPDNSTENDLPYYDGVHSAIFADSYIEGLRYEEYDNTGYNKLTLLPLYAFDTDYIKIYHQYTDNTEFLSNNSLPSLIEDVIELEGKPYALVGNKILYKFEYPSYIHDNFGYIDSITIISNGIVYLSRIDVFTDYNDVANSFNFDIENISTDLDDFWCADSLLFADKSKISVNDGTHVFELSGTPVFWLNGLWYEFDCSCVFECECDVGFYEVLTKCRYICSLLAL